VRIPEGATVIDAKGRYVVPGFIDTNLHLSLYVGVRDRYESLVRYHSRQNEIVLEAALEARRRNAQKLIQAGCLITIGTDNYWGAAPELSREPKPEYQDHGIGTIIGIESLVELGMTPSQAIVSATKSGATACRRLSDLGTIETGKLADLLILDGDPLADIRNIANCDLS
jgi:imidazolonepropionase-like amidohydrolase